MTDTVLTPFASVTDMAEWIGDTIEEGSADWKRAGRVLAFASNKVRSYTGRRWNEENGAVPPDLPPIIVDITIACASRFFLNPTGETQWSRQIDDAMDGGSRRVEEAGLYLTASEKDELDRLMAAESPVIAGIGTIGVTRGDAGSPDGDDVWYGPESQHALDVRLTGDA